MRFLWVLVFLVSGPLWAQGTWEALPGTLYKDAVDYQAAGGSASGSINAWNTMVWQESTQCLLDYVTGGHADDLSNDFNRYCLDVSNWEVVLPYTTAPDTSTCVETDADGRPRSRHTYGGQALIPALKGFPERIFTHGGSLACGSGGFGRGTWLTDLSTNTETLIGVDLANGPSNDIIFCEFDTVTEKIWCAGAGDGWFRFYSFDPFAGDLTTAWQQHIGPFSNAYSVDQGSQAVIINDPASPLDRHFVMLTGLRNPGDLVAIDIDNPVFQTFTLTGDTAIAGESYMGLQYRSATGQLVAHSGTDDDIDPKSIWEIDLSSFVITEVTHTTGPSLNTGSVGDIGKWRYIESGDFFLLVNAADQPVYKLSFGPSGSPPAQVTDVSVDMNVHSSTTAASGDFVGVIALPETGTAADFDLAPCPTGVCKHVRQGYRPADGRWYFFGGDHINSGENRVWSLDVGLEDFDLEQGMCRADLGPQPHEPDEWPFIWNTVQDKGWAFGGASQGTPVCAGEDHGEHAWSFDPNILSSGEPLYTNETDTNVIETPKLVFGGLGSTHKSAVYDPVDNRVYFPTGDDIRWYDYDDAIWGKVETGLSSSVYFAETNNHAIDLVRRKIYTNSSCTGKMGIFDLNIHAWEAFPDLPKSIESCSDADWFVIDTESDVLIWAEFKDAVGEVVHMNVMDLATQEWTMDIPYTTPVPGCDTGSYSCIPRANHVFYDEATDLVVMYGDAWTDQHQPYMFLYRF